MSQGACAAIRRTSASGGTALYNALYTTIKQMQKVHSPDGEIRRQAIALFTDGDDTTSLVTFDDLLVLAKQAGIAIYTIVVEVAISAVWFDAARILWDSEFGDEIARAGAGARSFFPTDISQLAGVYSLITQELSTRTSLGYTSTNPKQDGASAASSCGSTSPTCAPAPVPATRSRRHRSR